MSFEAVQSRAARTVFDRLANVSVTWSGAADPVRARWDERYLESLGVSSRGPRVRFHAADVPGIAPAQTVTKGGVVYRIDSVEPDGKGYVECPLKRNA